jgi:hypothetical protein
MKVKAGRATVLGRTRDDERKLLSFKLAAGRALQHREAGLSGARDGKWCRKFRGIYRLRRHTGDVLAASRTGGEVNGGRSLRAFEAVAAQPAGRLQRTVETNRHSTPALRFRSGFRCAAGAEASRAGSSRDVAHSVFGSVFFSSFSTISVI